MIGTSEAMNLGVKLGMDPKVLASIINTSSGKCWFLFFFKKIFLIFYFHFLQIFFKIFLNK